MKQLTPEQYAQVKTILNQVLDSPPENRARLARQLCMGNDVLLTAVMKMLQAEQTAFMEVSALDIFSLKARPDVPDTIHHYDLLKQIGSGGMGDVFLGQQQAPADRLVAIKLLKPLLNQDRLKDECHALAQLNHPNIATLYEVGQWAQDQLYIAMEYIEGDDVLTWCEAHQVGLNRRLIYFQQLCNAIQYAHEQGIIHCDIKPSNVLLSESTGVARVKVIDFGIAQYESGQSQPSSGTFEYMSPESLYSPLKKQRPSPQRDVFALGVLLEKLSLSASKKMSNDLRHIIKKAKAKNIKHRYASVQSLNDDIEKFLNHEVISARPQTSFYKAKMFVQRNKGVVAFSTALFVTLLAGIVAQRIEANKAKEQALQAELARIEAEAARDEAQDLSDFMVEIFRTTNPDKSQNSKTTVLDMLNKASDQLLALNDPKLSESRFMFTLGAIYTRMDHLEHAQSLLEKALEVKKLKQSHFHPDTIEVMAQLGVTYRRLKKTEQAKQILNEALIGLESGERDMTQEAFIHNHLGNIHWQLYEIEQAIVHHKQAVELRKELGDQVLLADSLNNLAVIYQIQKQWNQSNELMGQALEIYKDHYGGVHPYVAGVLNNMALNQEHIFEFEQSKNLLIESMNISTETYGPRHTQTIRAQTNLAKFYSRRHEFEKANSLWQSITDSYRQKDRLSELANSYSHWGLMHLAQGQLEKAMEMHRTSFQVIKGHKVSDVKLEPRLRSRLAKTLVAMGKVDQAKNEVADALTQVTREGDFFKMYLQNQLAEIQLKMGDVHEAQSQLKQVLAVPSKNHLIETQKVEAHFLMGQISHSQNDYRKAIEQFRKAHNLNLTIYPQGHISHAKFLVALGAEKIKLEESFEEGKFNLMKALSIQQAGLVAGDAELIKTQELVKSLDQSP